jgi:hypothetical protein
LSYPLTETLESAKDFFKDREICSAKEETLQTCKQLEEELTRANSCQISYKSLLADLLSLRSFRVGNYVEYRKLAIDYTEFYIKELGGKRQH